VGDDPFERRRDTLILIVGSADHQTMNQLYYGDNLTVMRGCIADESVDLIYLDPPFNSQATYNVLFKSTAGEKSHAQIEAFLDAWHWGEEAELAFDGVMRSGNSDAAEMLRAMRAFLKENDMMAYLSMMAVRLLELHRVLKPAGSIYLHCDPTAGHYLRILLDGIFGKENFRNELIWKRTSARSDSHRWNAIHDTIFFYSKGDQFTWNPQFISYDPAYTEKFYHFVEEETGRRYASDNLTAAGTRNGSSGDPWHGIDVRSKGIHWKYTIDGLEELDRTGKIIWPKKEGGVPRFKRYLDEMRGLAIQSIITDIPPLSAQSAEKLGYPTQKPLALLERIISASTNEDDVVLDPFCGCGTAVHAAQKLHREWIGIDITHLAISLIEKRLKDAFPGIQYEVHGTPKDLEGARDLAARDKYQFQWWAVSLVNAVPFAGKKKGADSGIDGLIYFKPEGKTTEKAIVSVKGGEHVNVAMVRDLAHVVDRENAKIGVFITLADSTGPMRTEAVKAGFYETLYGRYPKIQILTIQELFEGKQPNIPLIDSSSFKKAPKEARGDQDVLTF
jgi:site-specific DNA-methyltransferase (adenine-specific)